MSEYSEKTVECKGCSEIVPTEDMSNYKNKYLCEGCHQGNADFEDVRFDEYAGDRIDYMIG